MDGLCFLIHDNEDRGTSGDLEWRQDGVLGLPHRRGGIALQPAIDVGHGGGLPGNGRHEAERSDRRQHDGSR